LQVAVKPLLLTFAPFTYWLTVWMSRLKRLGVQDAVDTSFATAMMGGKVMLVGIPDEERTSFSASAARRKGVTIKLVRRMKHTYPRQKQSKKGVAMTTNRRKKVRAKPTTKMTSLDTVVCYVATLILAGFIAQSGIDSPAVWGFLGVAIGLLFGKVST
jgi:hypothetical protein